jgi:hypothetical protein
MQYVDPTGNFWFIPALIAIAKAAAVVSAVATVGGIVSAATGNQQLASTFFNVGMIAGAVSLVAGIGAYAFSSIAAGNIANEVGANLANSFAEQGSIELERIIVRKSAQIVAQEAAWQVAGGAVKAGVAGAASSAVSAAASALTTALSSVVTPIYNTVMHLGYNYGMWMYGEKNLGTFYGACLDSAYAATALVNPVNSFFSDQTFYQYYGPASKGSTWVTKTLYDPSTAMQKLSAPGQWNAMRQVKVPWYKWVEGPRPAAPNFGQPGWGAEYRIGGFKNWGKYFNDWGKTALKEATKIFGK